MGVAVGVGAVVGTGFAVGIGAVVGTGFAVGIGAVVGTGFAVDVGTTTCSTGDALLPQAPIVMTIPRKRISPVTFRFIFMLFSTLI
jgi:carbonic anhydrase/acetyltransferase-like protein (isoleucine patch superfamily)